MTPERSASSPEAPCPCGLSGSLATCCGRYLFGSEPAPRPEALMRSRYTAFTLGTADAIEYLVATHHAEFRSDSLRAGLVSSIESVDAWERLEVHESREIDDRGVVEFVATYRRGSELLELRERSNFVREAGRWYYTTGELD